MSDSTLAAIRKKVRRLTASPSTNKLSQSDLDEYIDTFYEQDLPGALKTWNLKSNLTFYTVEGEDRYQLDTSIYQSVMPPVYVDGYESYYCQTQTELFRLFPNIPTTDTTAGDGTAGAYSITLSSTPVVKRQVTVTALDSSNVTQTAYDSPQAANNFVGDLIDSSDDTTVLGTINYSTGVISITFPNTIPTTENITTSYVSYAASRPTTLCFFNDYFQVRPIPDRAYRIQIQVYQRPTQLLSANSNDPANTPDVHSWWQYIAYGAAMKVMEDRGDVEGAARILPLLKQQEALILYRTASQQSSQRSQTIYADQASSSPTTYPWSTPY